jgi:oligopeptidase A
MTTTASQNPLLEQVDMVRYDAIEAEHIVPAVDAAIAAADREIDRLQGDAVEASWTSFVEPLEAATERVGHVWSVASHLIAVKDSPELRVAYNACLPKITEFWTRLSQNTVIFEKYRTIEAAPSFTELSPTRCRVVNNALRDFRLGGAELPAADKARFAAIEDELAQLSQMFSEHVLDATNDFVLDLSSVKDLDGLPEDALSAARTRAEQAGVDGYRITLHMPSYLAVMQFARDRPLRETVYAAYAKRASEFGKPEQDNGPLITRILALRAEAASLLQYTNYASLAMVPKMAETPEDVLGFLEQLRIRAKPFGERDMVELSAFAKEHLGIGSLAAWDIAYASERLREHRYSYSQQEVKAYFPESKVLAGLFRVVGQLFGIEASQRSGSAAPPLWHPDVKFFDLIDRSGTLVAQFYLDLYARPGKRSGAWMASARSRSLQPDGKRQTPIAYLTCNFSEPLRDASGGTTREALFTHSEVNTLFHEFGHGLHHMLTRIDEAAVSGIRGVEWDAVELPSQFLENFCWEWDVVQHMTAHIDTGEPIPRALFDRMLAAKNFQAGMQTLRQLEFAIFDMKLHSRYDVHGTRSILDLLEEVREEVAVFKVPDYNRQPNQFSHIFAGGYAAGYYSYKWAEVLSADAYAQFEEDGVLNAATGARFLDEILGVGGSRPALESFVSFRGRKPDLEALLRHNGMVETA